MPSELVGRDKISPADEVGDIGVIVVGPIFTNTIPGSNCESESSPLESELCINPIPASRQGVLTTVGLMDKADIDESTLQSEQIVVSMNHAHDFWFVIAFAKWRRFRFVVHLEE